MLNVTQAFFTTGAATLVATAETFGRAPLPYPWAHTRFGMLDEDPRHCEAVATTNAFGASVDAVRILEPKCTGPRRAWTQGKRYQCRGLNTTATEI